MRLIVQWVDMRGGYAGPEKWYTDVFDEDARKTIGFVEQSRSPAARRISLFDGKYCGDFKSHDECAAFAKGVEAVLTHLTAMEAEDVA